MNTSSCFTIDTSIPFILYGKSRSVDELVKHQVSKYLHFMSVKHMRIRIGPVVWNVPTDRSRIFSDKNLKLTEKRGLMTLFKSAAQNQSSSVHSTALVGGESGGTASASSVPELDSEIPADIFLKRFNIERSEIVLGIIHGVCMYPLPASTMKAIDMMKRLSLFVASLDAYESGCPFLIPTYGNGDIPQAFARIAAVHGATQILGCDIDRIKTELGNKDHHVVTNDSEDNGTNHISVIHGVIGTKLVDNNDMKDISLEVVVDTMQGCYPWYCLTIPHPVSGEIRPGMCPSGTCLRHIVKIVDDIGKDRDRLTEIVNSYTQQDPVLFKRMFVEKCVERDVGDFFGIESCIDKATRTFNRVMNRDLLEPLPVPPLSESQFEEPCD